MMYTLKILLYAFLYFSWNLSFSELMVPNVKTRKVNWVFNTNLKKNDKVKKLRE